jgi:hypothetical protein
MMIWPCLLPLNKFSDSGDSTVTAKKTNCHHAKVSGHKASSQVGDSSDSISNFLGRKR